MVWTMGFAAVLVVVTSLIPTPLARARHAEGGGSLLAASDVNAATLSLFRRACSNCHSTETAWPWYSKVAPASWLVESDVLKARKAMNLSRWLEYGPQGQGQLLELVAKKIEVREMPPARYLALHPEARLTSEERAIVSNWSRQEMRRI